MYGVWLLFAAFLLNTFVMLGQSQSLPDFQFTVAVTDSNGAVVSKASVVIEHNAEQITARTNMDGVAHLRVPLGHYTVRVSATGFKTAEFTDYPVNDDSTSLNAVLEVGRSVFVDGLGGALEIQTVPSTLPWRLPEDTTAGDEPHCKSNPKLVGACFTVRGRLSYWNGTPSTRIWIVGTQRVLGLSEEDTDLPSSVKAHLRAFGDEIIADYFVCPLTKYRKGEMQMVCVQSASEIQFTHVKE